jgi:hypothetical protein
MKGGTGTISKYGRADTPSKLSKRWKESQDDIILAESGEACERLIALQRFQKECAERKKRRLLEEVQNIDLLFNE